MTVTVTTIMTDQNWSFTGFKPSIFQFQAHILNKCMTTQCCRVVVVDDVLGSKNKTNVPLYFSMLNHNGLLLLSKHTMNGPI